MASISRTTQLATLQKILKKHYEPVATDSSRSLLEHLIFACLLESAPHKAAEEAYASIHEEFFDYNEIRVTSIAELSEVLHTLPDPRDASHRLKRVLQSVFEELYSFDLEDKKKGNLGPTVKWLESLDGTTKFSVSYVVQASLAGHSIPTNKGVVKSLHVVGFITDKELEKRVVPGLERAIPKSKGVSFASILHQLGIAMMTNPYAPTLKKLLLEISPDAKDRLPKRRLKKTVEKEAAEAKKATLKKRSKKAQRLEAEENKAEKATTKKTATKKAATEKKTPVKKTTKKAATKKTPVKKATTKKAATKKSATKKTTKKATSSKATGPKAAAKTTRASKKSTAKITKKKPR